MGWSPEDHGLDSASASAADTVIFVDVDGVLNVGARDDSDGDAPLLVNEEGMRGALKMFGKHKRHPMRNTIERLVSIAKRRLGQTDSSSYMKLACKGESQVSDVLVDHLVKLIVAAGEHRIVVLSSKWQKYPKRVEGLEKDISRHLGSPFAFDGRSGLEAECSAECRIGTVGKFLENFLAWRGEPVNKLRVLMLEDFHITPLDGWTIGGIQVDSEETAEEYLRQQMPVSENITVKLIHTYDEWTTPSGLLVQLGAGLSKAHFSRAAAFLGVDSVDCENTGTQDVALPGDVPTTSCNSVQVPSNGNGSNNGAADNASNGKRKHDRDAPESPRRAKVLRAMPRRKACKPPTSFKLFKSPDLHPSDEDCE